MKTGLVFLEFLVIWSKIRVLFLRICLNNKMADVWSQRSRDQNGEMRIKKSFIKIFHLIIHLFWFCTVLHLNSQTNQVYFFNGYAFWRKILHNRINKSFWTQSTRNNNLLAGIRKIERDIPIIPGIQTQTVNLIKTGEARLAFLSIDYSF